MNSNENLFRDFKGIWIPKEIWLNKEINTIQKVLLAEIDSLSIEKGCYASNEYLSKFIGISKRQTISYISDLKNKGYLQQKSFNGRQRILRTNMKTGVKKTSPLT